MDATGSNPGTCHVEQEITRIKKELRRMAIKLSKTGSITPCCTIFPPLNESVIFSDLRSRVKWIQEDMKVHLNGDGSQSRGFTYVDDIASGTIAALKPLGYEIINLGGHELMTITSLIETLERIIGKKADLVHHPRHLADILASQANVDKARKVLGWEPRVSLEDGIQEVVNWYHEERSWVKDIVTEYD